MSALFATTDWSQDICEICGIIYDTAKRHLCSMRRAMRLRAKRHGSGPFQPMTLNPMSVEEKEVFEDEPSDTFEDVA